MKDKRMSLRLTTEKYNIILRKAEQRNMYIGEYMVESSLVREDATYKGLCMTSMDIQKLCNFNSFLNLIEKEGCVVPQGFREEAHKLWLSLNL